MRNFKETFPFTLLLGIFHITFCSYKGHYAEIFACIKQWTMFLKIKWEKSIKIKKAFSAVASMRPTEALASVKF